MTGAAHRHSRVSRSLAWPRANGNAAGAVASDGGPPAARALHSTVSPAPAMAGRAARRTSTPTSRSRAAAGRSSATSSPRAACFSRAPTSSSSPARVSDHHGTTDIYVSTPRFVAHARSYACALFSKVGVVPPLAGRTPAAVRRAGDRPRRHRPRRHAAAPKLRAHPRSDLRRHRHPGAVVRGRGCRLPARDSPSSGGAAGARNAAWL